jgi:hypothetical protein
MRESEHKKVLDILLSSHVQSFKRKQNMKKFFMQWQDDPALFSLEKEKYLDRIKRKYGLSGLKNYLKALVEQKGKCKICRRKMILVGDHKPGTRKFRGLLCFWCNSILGNIERMPWIVNNIRNYLNS